MIGWEDAYKVAMAPLYVALVLGYGSIRWWKIFTPDQGGAVNRLVCYFTIPLFTFEFTAHVDPFKMNHLFIGADAISKFIIVLVLVFWAKLSSKGSYTWSITSFSLCTLTNSLVVGVPLMKAMYGQMAVDLVVQSSVVQAIIWLTILLIVLEFRRTILDISSSNTSRGDLEKDLEGSGSSLDNMAISSKPSFWALMKVVWLKLAMNPNSYAWIFMAVQEKLIACGAGLTVIGMILRFIAAPAAMAIGSIAVGLHGDVLRVAIIQSDLRA